MERIRTLICELDRTYQSCLDVLERQVREADDIDRSIRQLFAQSDGEQSILDWNPEKAVSPARAFRSLAMRLVEASHAAVTRDMAVRSIDYEDLLAWPNEQASANPTADEILQRIAYARKRSLAAFWDGFVVRIAPDADPRASERQASLDLIAAFAVDLPDRLVVPYYRVGQRQAFAIQMLRAVSDIDWVVPAETLPRIVRTNHALSSMCYLNHQPKVARALHEANSQMLTKFRQTFRQYRPGDSFQASDYLLIRFKRSHVEFILEDDLHQQVRSLLPRFEPSLRFVSASQVYD